MNSCTRTVCFTYYFQICNNFTSSVFLVINLTVFIDSYIQLSRQSIYNRRTNAVQTTRYLVATSAKFTSGMEHCEDRLNSWATRSFLNINRNTASIINNGNRIICLNENFNFIRKSCQRLVNRVIDNFPHQMM